MTFLQLQLVDFMGKKYYISKDNKLYNLNKKHIGTIINGVFVSIQQSKILEEAERRIKNNRFDYNVRVQMNALRIPKRLEAIKNVRTKYLI